MIPKAGRYRRKGMSTLSNCTTTKEHAALAIIDAGLAKGRRPYVAFSGGKDSLVVAHLVSRVDADITLVYADDELIHDEHAVLIDRYKARMGDRLRIVRGQSIHKWFRTWTDAPFWRQPNLSIETLDRSPRQKPLSAGEFAGRLGYDTAILGLRREESLRRAAILDGNDGISKLNRVTYVNPIIDWTTDDVWGYIIEHGLDYCSVYDRLTEIGIPRHKQRLGPLPLTHGRTLWRGWPGPVRRATSALRPALGNAGP